MPLKTLALLICALAALPASGLSLGDARQLEGDLPRFDAERVVVEIDGRLDEAIWDAVPGWSDFRVIEPDTLAVPDAHTEVRMFYTDQGLYVGVLAEQDPATRVTRLTARDQGVNRDSISITLDPTGEGRHGYWFTVALGGSVQDGTVVPERNYSSEWDGPWLGAAAETDSGWSAEFFLPWSMMVMPGSGEVRQIAYYISRKVAHLDERWAMPALPTTEPRFMSALEPLKLRDVSPQPQFTAFPYLSTAWDANRSKLDYRLGTDLYWRPTPNFQVSTTLSPDFGTVEQDDLVVNLSAFESFFSEKRAFFLEGQDVFVSSPRATGEFANAPRLTLVNTRRIGAPAQLPAQAATLAIDPRDRSRLSELHGAGKLTGQLGGFRFGALAAAERDTKLQGFDLLGEPVDLAVRGRRFGALRGVWDLEGAGAQRRLGATLTAVDAEQDNAWVAAMDGQLLSADGTWKVDTQALVSRVDEGKGVGFVADTVYTPRRGQRHTLSLDFLDDALDVNAFGFLSRNDSQALRYRYEGNRSDLDGWRERRTTLRLIQAWNTEGRVVNSGLFAERRWVSHDLSNLRGELAFRPARWDDRNSRGNGAFRIDDRFGANAAWNSDSSQRLSYGVELDARQEDLGDLAWFGEGFVAWRPRTNVSARLDLRYRERDGWLLHQQGREFTLFDAREWRPRFSLDYFFNARQHLRVSLQWVGLQAEERDVRSILDDGHLGRRARDADAPAGDFAISNMVFQMRYRWEMAPLSDLFVVYSRGGSLEDALGREFSDMLRASFANPDENELVVKLRYRFGS